MAKKENDSILDKKTREQFKQDIMEEINTKYKDDICASIADDVKSSFDHEYKEEIKNQISDELIVDIKKNIEKEQRKLTRSKNFKIFRLYIYILLLIASAGYMIYCLYVSDSFDILKNMGVTTPANNETTTTTTTTVVKNLSWYVEKYGNLLDNVKITDYSLLNTNVNIATLPSEVRLSLAYQVLDKESIVVDGIINSIKEEDLLLAYNKVFGSEEGYVASNFTVNDTNYAYSTNNKSFIAIYKDKVELTPATNKIIDIKEENGNIVISAIVVVVKDNKIYNITDLEEPIGDMGDIDKYSDQLTKVDYRFKNIGGNYYIDSITKR